MFQTWRTWPRIFWIWLAVTVIPLLMWWAVLAQVPQEGVSGRVTDFGPHGFRISQIISDEHFLLPGDCVVAIEGRSVDDLLNLTAPHPQPQSRILHYRVWRDGQEITLPGFVQRPTLSEVVGHSWLTVLLGVVALVLGAFILLARPDHPFNRMLAWTLAGVFVQSMTGAFNFPPAWLLWGWPFWGQLAFELSSFAITWLGLLFTALTFPRPWPERPAGRLLVHTGFTLSSALIAGWTLFSTRHGGQALQASTRTMLAVFSIEGTLVALLTFYRLRQLRGRYPRPYLLWLGLYAIGLLLLGLTLPLLSGAALPSALKQGLLALLALVVIGLFYLRVFTGDPRLLGMVASLLGTIGLAALFGMFIGLALRAPEATPYLISLLVAFLILLYNPLHQRLQHNLARLFPTDDQRIRRLHQAAQAIAQARTLPELNWRLQAVMAQVFPDHRAALYHLRGYTLQRHEPPLGHSNLPEQIPLRAYQVSRLKQEPFLLLAHPLKALVFPIHQPLMLSQPVTGALVVTPPPLFYTWLPEEREALYTLVRQIGLIWHLAQALEERTQAMQKEMELLQNTVTVLVQALGYRDHYTESHSQAMVELAEAIGRILGLSEERLHDLRWATLLHDIGKIAIPDHILNKPASLDAEERHIIQQHPELGAALLRRIPGMERVAEIVRCHHERYDGKGYPRGLKGEEIPLEARIIAVVDAFHAIIEDRAYRTGRSMLWALREIERHAGWQFDPQVVIALKEALRQRGDLLVGATKDDGAS